MSKSPQISVILPVFNGERYIREAIESILNQTFGDFELVIVDDASTDHTVELISSFHDKRINLLQNKRNLGQTCSLNIGIRNSCGHYIARMDADDWAFPERFETQLHFLEENPDIVLVGSYVVIEQEGYKPRLFRVPIDPIAIKCFLSVSGDLSFWCIAHSTVMIRREVLEEAGLYNEERGAFPGYPQDYDLWSKLSRNHLFANIPKPLLKYRFFLESDSRAFLDKQLQERWCISQERIEYNFSDMGKEDLTTLGNMIEFRPQFSAAHGRKVFGLFDRYFSKYVGPLITNEKVKKIQNQIKLYYLPQLFFTNKLLAAQSLAYVLIRYPTFLFDMRFYRKWIKTLLLHCIPPKYHVNLIVKFSAYR